MTLETVTPLLQVLCDMPCEICGNGVMRPELKKGGLSAVPATPQPNRGVRHVCTSCGQVSTYKDAYPVVKHVNFLDFIKDSQAVLNKLKQERENGGN